MVGKTPKKTSSSVSPKSSSQMFDWKKVTLFGLAMSVASQAVHMVEAALNISYYLDPRYFQVWSPVMMPTNVTPTVGFVVASFLFGFVVWALFGTAFEVLRAAGRCKEPVSRGFEFGFWVFLLGSGPGALNMLLLFHLPLALIASWTLISLLLNLVGGALAVHMFGIPGLGSRQ